MFYRTEYLTNGFNYWPSLLTRNKDSIFISLYATGLSTKAVWCITYTVKSFLLWAPFKRRSKLLILNLPGPTVGVGDTYMKTMITCLITIFCVFFLFSPLSFRKLIKFLFLLGKSDLNVTWTLLLCQFIRDTNVFFYTGARQAIKPQLRD